MKHTTYKRWSGLLLLLLSFALTETKGQAVKTPVEEWTTQEGTQYLFHQSATVTDASNNVYKTGATINSNGDYDIITVKYNSSGVQQWIAQYAGAGGGDDTGANLVVDGSGNVFVAGAYFSGSTDSSNAILIKYNSSGTQQWTATYDGGQGRGDGAANLVIDAGTGDIYVCGSTYKDTTDQYDFLILKYNSSGTQQWAARWDNLNLWDAAYQIKYRSGKVSVSGGTQTSATKYEFATANFSSSGTFVNSIISSGNNPIGFNKVSGMVQDAAGNLYITGSVVNSNYDCYTMKLDNSLTQLWSATYNGSSNLNDIANDIQIDGNGNVYITGFTTTVANGTDYLTVKYNSTGTQQWAVTYNGPKSGNDEASSVAINTNNDVYITGWTFNGGNKDYLTMKLDPATGSTLWNITYNSILNAEDRATDIVIDDANAIIVSGQGQDITGEMAYTTVKYKELSVITPHDTLAGSWQFIENRGQLRGSDSLEVSTVEFYNNYSAPAVYFMNDKTSFVYSQLDTISTDNDTLCRVDMAFIAANTTKVYSLEKREDHFSYFVPPVEANGVGMVPLFKRLISPEVYSNIDVMYASNADGLRMYFIVKPGGKPGDIQWNYTGANSVSVGSNGYLSVVTDLGTFTHPRALAYEIDNNGNRTNLSWHPTYTNSSGDIQITGIGSYTSTSNLVIEVNFGNTPPPTVASTQNMNWSTYYGGQNDESFNDVKIDANGELLVVGHTNSSNFPVSTGTIVQPSHGGSYDAVVMKFDTLGVRKWATYYGGTGLEFGHSIVPARNSGDIYFTGTTTSTNFPTQQSTNTASHFDNTYAGGNDLFVVKLNSLGSVKQWATLYGGAGAESGYGIEQDTIGNTLIVGTGNNSPTLSKTGAYNNSTFSGASGLILKFNTNDSLVWATRYPVNLINDVTSFQDRFYITGNVGSAILPLLDPGSGAYFDSTWNAGSDAYITSFNGLDTLAWSTYYAGNGADLGEAIVADKQIGTVWITGQAGSTDFPLFHPGGSAYIDSTRGFDRDMFIGKFTSTGVMQWSTYYGGREIEYGRDIAVDRYSVYVLGDGNTSGMASATSDPFPTLNATGAFYEDTLRGNIDMYILAFNKTTCAQKWGTLFGGGFSAGSSGIEYGWGLAVDGQHDFLYLVGESNSRGVSVNSAQHYPLANPGNNAWYITELNAPSNNGGYYDGVISRFGTLPITSVGIESNLVTFNQDISIYPNPAQDNVLIVFDLKEKQNVEIIVYNVLGAQVYNERLGERVGSVQQQVDLSAWSDGIYFVQVKLNNQAVTKKVIKN